MACTLEANWATVKPPGTTERARTPARALRILVLLRSTPPTLVDPIFEATGNSSRILSGRKPMSTQSSMLMKRSVIARELGEDLGEAVERPATTECLGVVDDRFEAQHVLAFGVPLQGQQSEVDLEQEEVPLRCLDHDRLPGRQLVAPVVAAAALLDAEQGWQLGHVEAGTDPVDHRVEHGVQLGPVAEQQVAAVLDL